MARATQTRVANVLGRKHYYTSLTGQTQGGIIHQSDRSTVSRSDLHKRILDHVKLLDLYDFNSGRQIRIYSPQP